MLKFLTRGKHYENWENEEDIRKDCQARRRAAQSLYIDYDIKDKFKPKYNLRPRKYNHSRITRCNDILDYKTVRNLILNRKKRTKKQADRTHKRLENTEWFTEPEGPWVNGNYPPNKEMAKELIRHELDCFESKSTRSYIADDFYWREYCRFYNKDKLHEWILNYLNPEDTIRYMTGE